MNLKIIRTEEISIDSIGEQSTELKQDDLVAFNIPTKSTTDKIKVRALDVKCLCNRLKGHNINLDPLKYPKLHQVEIINDCEHDNDRVRLLLDIVVALETKSSSIRIQVRVYLIQNSLHRNT